MGFERRQSVEYVDNASRIVAGDVVDGSSYLIPTERVNGLASSCAHGFGRVGQEPEHERNARWIIALRKGTEQPLQFGVVSRVHPPSDFLRVDVRAFIQVLAMARVNRTRQLVRQVFCGGVAIICVFGKRFQANAFDFSRDRILDLSEWLDLSMEYLSL